MKKIFCLSMVLFLCLSAAVIFGLQGKVTAAEKQLTIAYIPPNQSEPWHVACYKSGKFFAEDLGIKLILLDPRNDPSQQIKMAHDIAPQVDAAVIIPVSAEAYKMAEEFKKRKDIPVIALDRDAKTKAIDLFIAYDNTEAGRAVARQGVEFLTKKFGEPKGKVVLVVGDLSSQPGIERRAGSLEIFKKHPKIEVVAEAESVKWTTESAQSQLMAIFQASNEPPDAIISHTIPTPALNALRSKGWLKKAGDSGHVILVGINASWDALKNLKDGNVDGIVDQPNMVYLPMGLYYAKLAAEKGSGALPKPGDTVTGKDVPLSEISSAHGGINVLKEPFWAPGKVSGNPAMMHPQLLIKGGVVDLTTVDSPIFFGNALRMWEKAGK